MPSPRLVYETLLTLHPTTLQYVPVLATHWQISPDKLTYRFRLDPNARFSNGTPVTAEDVVASWVFHTDKSLQDLYFYTEFNKLEKPVAESKYIVRIKAKDLQWSNFLMASTGLRVFPAHVLKTLDGAELPARLQLQVAAGDRSLHGRTTATSRRARRFRFGDGRITGAKKYRVNVGLYNFDEFRFTVVRDREPRVRDVQARGPRLLQRQHLADSGWRISTSTTSSAACSSNERCSTTIPSNTQFLAFNTRRQPWDDVRMRQAFALLLQSRAAHQDVVLQRVPAAQLVLPGNDLREPEQSQESLQPAGGAQAARRGRLDDRDQQGRLVKNGKPLQIELLYSDKGCERWLTVYQEDLRKVGIGMNLRLVNPETQFKMHDAAPVRAGLQRLGSGQRVPDRQSRVSLGDR